jgi:hypothetical protein
MYNLEARRKLEIGGIHIVDLRGRNIQIKDLKEKGEKGERLETHAYRSQAVRWQRTLYCDHSWADL